MASARGRSRHTRRRDRKHTYEYLRDVRDSRDRCAAERGLTGEVPYVTWCEAHRKRSYDDTHSRVQERHLRRVSERPEGIRRYRCDALAGGAHTLWHVGHVPGRVRRGTVTASEWYGDGGRHHARDGTEATGGEMTRDPRADEDPVC